MPIDSERLDSDPSLSLIGNEAVWFNQLTIVSRLSLWKMGCEISSKQLDNWAAQKVHWQSV